jgi:hypothetical protein
MKDEPNPVGYYATPSLHTTSGSQEPPG